MSRTAPRLEATSSRLATVLRNVHLATTPRSSLNRRHAPRLLALAIVFCNACTGPEAAKSTQSPTLAIPSNAARFSQLDSVDAPNIPMRKIGTVTLGNSPTTTADSIAFAVVTSHGIVLYDNASHLLRGYTKSGSEQFSLPTRSGIGHLGMPMQLVAIAGDSVLVVDIDEARGLTVVTPNGVIARQLPLHLGGALVGGAQLSNGNFALARITTQKELGDSTAHLAAIVNPAGKLLATGCAPDSVSRASVVHNGMYGFFRGAGVAALNGRIYCWQAVTPIVQVLSIDGTPIGSLNNAPPFYHRGADQPASTNAAEMNRFRSTWWDHLGFLPLVDGFVSSFDSYDPKTAHSVFRLFACDSSSVTSKCHTSDVPGTPVAFVAPDTLYVSEPLKKPSQLRQLGIYVMSSH